MFWRKDGEELHEDVEPGEILPNHDGSFQMSVDLKLSSVKPEDWKKYDCVFHLSGVKDDIVTKLDKAVIKSNEGKTGILTFHWLSPKPFVVRSNIYVSFAVKVKDVNSDLFECI